MTFKFENDTLSINIQENISLDEYKEISEHVGKIASIIQKSTHGLTEVGKKSVELLKESRHLAEGSMLSAVTYYKNKMGCNLTEAKKACDKLKAKYLK